MAKRKFTPIFGDLSKLTPEQQGEYVLAACEHLQVPPELGLVRLSLLDTGDGSRSLLLYVLKGATDLIRDRRKINVESLTPLNGDGYVGFTATGKDSSGRQEIAVGTVSIKGLSGKAAADCIMTAQTKSLRRMTLQFAGGGFLDETEIHEKTTNIATAASTLQQIAQPVVTPTSAAGKDITDASKAEQSPTAITPKAESPSTLTETSASEEKARKPRKKRTVSLDSDPGLPSSGSIKSTLNVVDSLSPSEHLEAQLEPRPEPPPIVEQVRAVAEAIKEQLQAPAVPQPKVEEKPFVGTRPTKEQGEIFRQKVSALVNDKLSQVGFRQSQGRSKHAKIGAFVQAMFPKADPKQLSVENQEYFLTWVDKKIAEVGALGLMQFINKTIGETDA